MIAPPIETEGGDFSLMIILECEIETYVATMELTIDELSEAEKAEEQNNNE